MDFVGAVLIGPFEGSHWRGGCGEGLWDLNGQFRLGQRLFLGLARSRTRWRLRRDGRKNLLVTQTLNLAPAYPATNAASAAPAA